MFHKTINQVKEIVKQSEERPPRLFAVTTSCPRCNGKGCEYCGNSGKVLDARP